MASDDNEHMALQFFGILFGGAILTAVLRWAATRVDADSAASGVRSWLLDMLPYAVGIVVTVVTLVLLRAWRRGRLRRRDEVRHVIAAALAPVMPVDWDDSMLIVTRWRGFVPMRGRLALSPTCRDDDLGWRDVVTTTIRARLGASVVEMTWPRPATRLRRPNRIATWAVDYASRPGAGRAAHAGRTPIGRYSHPGTSLSPPQD